MSKVEENISKAIARSVGRTGTREQIATVSQNISKVKERKEKDRAKIGTQGGKKVQRKVVGRHGSPKVELTKGKGFHHLGKENPPIPQAITERQQVPSTFPQLMATSPQGGWTENNEYIGNLRSVVKVKNRFQALTQEDDNKDSADLTSAASSLTTPTRT